MPDLVGVADQGRRQDLQYCSTRKTNIYGWYTRES